jgi:hypothetical protein
VEAQLRFVTLSHTRGRVVVGMLLPLLMVLLLGGTTASARTIDVRKASGTFVSSTRLTDGSPAPNPSAYIGFSLRNGHVIAYLCNGNRNGADGAQSVGEFFRGRARTRRVSLRSAKGARLDFRARARVLTGTVRLADGRVLSFRARRTKATNFAFLLRAGSGDLPTRANRSGDWLAGWIRLPNGTERGSELSPQEACAEANLKLRNYAKQFALGITLTKLERRDLRFWTDYHIANCVGAAP